MLNIFHVVTKINKKKKSKINYRESLIALVTKKQILRNPNHQKMYWYFPQL